MISSHTLMLWYTNSSMSLCDVVIILKEICQLYDVGWEEEPVTEDPQEGICHCVKSWQQLGKLETIA